MDKERKSEKKPFSAPKITDKAELAEVEKIAPSLDNDEKVLLVVKRMPELSVSGTIFATNKRIIMTSPGMVYGFSYEQLADVKLTMESYSYTLVIRTRDDTSDQTTPALTKKMTAIQGAAEWKEDKGSIRGIPKNKGEQLFKLVQYGIKESKS